MRPLAICDEGRKLIKWVEDKYLNFGKFLGVSMEGKEDKIIDLLLEIELDARGDFVGRNNNMVGWEGSSKRTHKGEKEVIVYSRRNKGMDKSKGNGQGV